MSDRSVTHATFVIERTYEATPARVFAAWSEPEAKARWANCHDDYELDFRVGGREGNRGPAPDGHFYAYEARFLDIVPERRIVYAYDMHRDDRRISVSLATVEFKPAGAGTRLVFTEQAAFLDGLERPESREQGTQSGLDRLASELEREPAAA